MILRLEQRQVAAARPASYHRLLTKLSRSISHPAAVSASLSPVSATGDGSFDAGEPASRPPEVEIGRKSGASRATRQTSASERSAHARTYVDDDVKITSSLRRTFNEV